MKHVEISVIIPLYKGKQYIFYLLETLYANFCNILSELCVQSEVIFVNDYPNEILEIEDCWTNKMNIQIVNLPVNGGIHNARITGLSMARGKYVLFLDQDDHITEDCIISQRKRLLDGDAVLCNGYIMRYCMSGKRVIYKNIIFQKRATSLEELITQGNHIISPGQVLIKKSSIPDLWRKVAMSKNGADDYLLWILMISEGKKININIDKLYTHIGQGKNSSQNVVEMRESLREMIWLLKDNHVLSQHQLCIIEKRVENSLESDKLLSIISLYDQWVHLKIRKKNIAEYLLKKGINHIAIYGMNYIGNRLYDELKNSEIKILVGIDQNADQIQYEIPILKLEDSELGKYIQEVNIIVVTTAIFYQEIKKDIGNYYQIPVVSMNDILLDMMTQ